MHEEDVIPPNKNSHAYNSSITYNRCDFYLLQFLLSPNAYLKDSVCKFVVSFDLDPVLVIAIKIVRHCTKMST